MTQQKRIINIGSCCIDHVYRVKAFVQPGETLACTDYAVHPGGKGLNQSIAIAYAGGHVQHAGCIGKDGKWLKKVLSDAGVETSLLRVAEASTGHANIQVNDEGENAIVLYGGTNQMVTSQNVAEWLDTFAAGDVLVLQNEVSELSTAMSLAANKGLRTIFNAAPMTDDVSSLPLDTLDVLIINEIEGAALTRTKSPEAIVKTLRGRLPGTSIVLTLGANGAMFSGPGGDFQTSAPRVDVVDTTGAGDTFTGYFIAGYSGGGDMEEVLAKACKAAALSVTRPGAASSIPLIEEVDTAAL